VNFPPILGTGILGLIFTLIFAGLILIFILVGKKRAARYLREIPAFERLKRSVGLAVEAGQRLHVSLGRGQFNGLEAASATIGLTVLGRVARTASVSDRPPVATSGEGTLMILSQDTLGSTYRTMGVGAQYDPATAQLTGVTPFSYAAGVMPVLFDQGVSTSFLGGHFGSEVALITDAADRTGGLTLAGSNNIPGQAVLYASAEEPLIGEELYAAGAYLNAGVSHFASILAQDTLRWLIILAILGGAVLKFMGVL
jgi:hypothetical protein